MTAPRNCNPRYCNRDSAPYIPNVVRVDSGYAGYWLHGGSRDFGISFFAGGRVTVTDRQETYGRHRLVPVTRTRSVCVTA